MWTVVYMSQDKSKIDKVLLILEEASVMTMLKTNIEDDFDMGTMYEILVPKTEIDTAQDLIFDIELQSRK